MKKYQTNPGAMSWPLCESPFFYDLIKNIEMTDAEREMAIQFHENGYIILDLGFTDAQLDEIKTEIDLINSNTKTKTQDERYHYSKGKRIFEGWKQSELLKNISLNEKVLNFLKLMYQRTPMPFQTITFNYGSNQPLHSDLLHFSSMPQRWMSACWLALEDMDENNGTLTYVPGSHKLPIFEFYDLNIKSPKFGEQFEAYAEYEEFLRQLVETKNLKTETLKCNRGQALIWSANLLHGGAEIKDVDRTRYSHVTHYYFEGCDKYYSPLFSEAWKGEFSEKDLTTKNFYNHE